MTRILLCRILAGRAHDAIRRSPLRRTRREATLLESEHACNVAVTFPQSVVCWRRACAIVHFNSLSDR
jgi:hypothetical protein